MNNNIGPNINAFNATGNKPLGKQEAKEEKLSNAGTKASPKSAKKGSEYDSQVHLSNYNKTQMNVTNPSPKGLNDIQEGLLGAVIAQERTAAAHDIVASIANMSLEEASAQLNPSTVAGLNTLG